MKSILLSVLLLATFVAAEYSTPPGDCSVYCADSAVVNKSIGPSGSVDKTAYFFDSGLFAPSTYQTQDGHCTLQAAFSANTLTITGVVYDPANPTNGFFINIQSTQTQTADNYLELDASAYVTGGGWIDPTWWLHYSLTSGSLTGFGAWQNVQLSLTESMHPLQVGAGANGKNGNLGLSAWFDFTYNGQMYMSDINVDLNCPPAAPTSAPTDAPTSAPATSAPATDAPATPTDAPATPTNAPVTSSSDDSDATNTGSVGSTSGSTSSSSDDNNGSTTGSTTGSTSSSSDDNAYTCPPNPFVAEQAIADQYGANSYFAFIFNTTNNVQYRFNFVNNAGSFQVNADGSASLTGNLAPLSYNPQDGVFDFDFSAVVNFIPGSAPAEYHKELQEGAYVPNGPVDPTTWQFFAFSSAVITPSNSAYSLSIAPYMDMEFQVGAGGNGKNVNYGASAWFQFYLVDNSNNNLVASGVMDINVDLVCENTGATGSATSGSASASQSESATTSVVTDGSLTGAEVTPSTSSSPSPATPVSSASTVSASIMAALLFVLALTL